MKLDNNNSKLKYVIKITRYHSNLPELQIFKMFFIQFIIKLQKLKLHCCESHAYENDFVG